MEQICSTIDPNCGSQALNDIAPLDNFLRSVQARAFRIAQLATSHSDDALDIVQDSMFKLVEKYANNPSSEWPPLFYRILNSKINDWYRKNRVRSRYQTWLSSSEDENEDPIQTAPDTRGQTPEFENVLEQGMTKLQSALQSLPPRQQQAFLLRAWQGLDVKQTALAMDCAEGSVKTHYSRAIHNLREQLGEHWS